MLADILIFLVVLFAVYFIVHRLLESLMVTDLELRPVLVTGCDTGFGNQLTVRCVATGISVFAACLTQEVCLDEESICAYMFSSLERI